MIDYFLFNLKLLRSDWFDVPDGIVHVHNDFNGLTTVLRNNVSA